MMVGIERNNKKYQKISNTINIEAQSEIKEKKKGFWKSLFNTTII